MIIISVENKKTWEDFLLKNSPHSFFQSWNWGEVEKSLGKKVWRMGIYKKYQKPRQRQGSPKAANIKNQKFEKTLVGISEVVKIEARRGTFLHIRHGPVFKNWTQEIFKTWLSYLKKIAKQEKAVFIRISPLINQDFKAIIENSGFREAPIHNMDAEATLLLELDQKEEILLAKMRKTTRNLIRKAKRMGVFVKKGQDKQKLTSFLSLFYETAKRGHFILERGIEKEFKIFSADKQEIVFLGGYNQEILAGAIIAFYGNQGIYRYAATSKKIKNIPSSYLIQWEAIKEAKKRGLALYNFWGGICLDEDKNHPWYGLTLFKKGFGGELKKYLHAQDLPLSPFYWKTFFIENLIKFIRGYASFWGLRAPSWLRSKIGL